MNVSSKSALPAIPMRAADMDFRSPPAAAEALEKAARHGICGYGDTDGEYDGLAADRYSRRMARRFKAGHILKVPGVI